jgi:hypothetical protein
LPKKLHLNLIYEINIKINVFLVIFNTFQYEEGKKYVNFSSRRSRSGTGSKIRSQMSRSGSNQKGPDLTRSGSGSATLLAGNEIVTMVSMVQSKFH